MAHNADSVNSAADFCSRLEPRITEKIRLNIREDVQTIYIEVTSSSKNADEEQFFFTQADGGNEIEEETLQ